MVLMNTKTFTSNFNENHISKTHTHSIFYLSELKILEEALKIVANFFM